MKQIQCSRNIILEIWVKFARCNLLSQKAGGLKKLLNPIVYLLPSLNLIWAVWAGALAGLQEGTPNNYTLAHKLQRPTLERSRGAERRKDSGARLWSNKRSSSHTCTTSTIPDPGNYFFFLMQQLNDRAACRVEERSGCFHFCVYNVISALPGKSSPLFHIKTNFLSLLFHSRLEVAGRNSSKHYSPSPSNHKVIVAFWSMARGEQWIKNWE